MKRSLGKTQEEYALWIDFVRNNRRAHKGLELSVSGFDIILGPDESIPAERKGTRNSDSNESLSCPLFGLLKVALMGISETV